MVKVTNREPDSKTFYSIFDNFIILIFIIYQPM